MSSDTLLLLEDHLPSQKLMSRFFEAHGFRVTVTGSTSQADEALARETPSLILLDLALPGEGGLALARKLKEQGSRIPVVAVTAHAMPQDRDVALAHGCTDYMPKPVDLRSLLKVVRRLCGRAGAP